MIPAMIFDLDGTLVQTEKLKALSYARAAVMLRPDLKEQEIIDGFGEVVGLARHELARQLLARFNLERPAAARIQDFSVDTPWQAYLQIRVKIYDELLLNPQVVKENIWPHTIALLKRARENSQKLGLATMSYCPQVQHILSILQLHNTFDFVASRDDVERGKPAPETYSMVSAQLAVPPSECLVIEDSPAGVKAALAAGMHCIAIGTPFTIKSLHLSGLLQERWIGDNPENLSDVVTMMLSKIKRVTGSP